MSVIILSVNMISEILLNDTEQSFKMLVIMVSIVMPSFAVVSFCSVLFCRESLRNVKLF